MNKFNKFQNNLQLEDDLFYSEDLVQNDTDEKLGESNSIRNFISKNNFLVFKPDSNENCRKN